MEMGQGREHFKNENPHVRSDPAPNTVSGLALQRTFVILRGIEQTRWSGDSKLCHVWTNQRS